MGVLKVNVGGQWINVGGLGPLPGRNLIDNGQMQVNQRGQASAGSWGSGIMVDRHWIQNNGIGTISLSYVPRTSFGGTLPAGRPDPGSIHYISQTLAEASGALAAGDYMRWQQSIEGCNLQHLMWGTPAALPVTLSFDVYSSVAATYVTELFRIETPQRNISKSWSVLAGVWTTITLTFPGDTTTRVTNDTGVRLYVMTYQGAGTNLTNGTPNSVWGAFNAIEAAGVTNNFAAGVSNVFSMTNVQLEVGSVATPYEVRRYDEELDRCLRYLQAYTLNASSVALAQSFSTLEAAALINFTKPMRAPPSFSYIAPLSDYILWSPGTAALACTALGQFGTPSPFAYSLRCTVASGLTTGSATTLLINAANRGLFFSSEM